MKKLTIIVLVVFLWGIISSCGIYKEPCEGVVDIYKNETNS